VVIRVGVVLGSLVVALASAILAVRWGGTFVAAVGLTLVPFVWIALHAIERFIGNDMWHFAAPYPYPWMRQTEDALSRGHEPRGHRAMIKGTDCAPSLAKTRRAGAMRSNASEPVFRVAVGRVK
jgi:hypothetical protein